MYTLPHESDLLWLFETEPAIEEPEDGREYTFVCYKTVRQGVTVECSFHAYYGDVWVGLSVADIRVAEFFVQDVTEVQVGKDEGREYLLVHSRTASVKPMRIQLKPHAKIEWGTIGLADT